MNDLPQRLAHGETAAFAELYDQCAARLHGYLRLRSGSPHDADDLVQETFIRLARSRRQLAEVDDLVAYVFTIARHEWHRLVARRCQQARQLAALPRAESFDDRQQREADDEIRAALTDLSDEQREVVELKIYGQFTFREIAEITGTAQGTVATRYRAALEKMRHQVLRDVT